MNPRERDALRVRFQNSCGYCGILETDVGGELTVDHFQPRSRDGLDDRSNWVYCCHVCNEYKGNYWQPNAVCRILHPLNDVIDDNIRLSSDGTLIGLTETGAFHIEHLRLNRAALVVHRRELQQLDDSKRMRSDLIDQLNRLESKIERLERKLDRLRRE